MQKAGIRAGLSHNCLVRFPVPRQPTPYIEAISFSRFVCNIFCGSDIACQVPYNQLSSEERKKTIY